MITDAPALQTSQQLSKEEVIYNDAAVLIETRAGIWDDLPPGAADLLDEVKSVVKG